MSAMRQIVSFKMIRRLNRLCVRTGWKLFVPSAVMAACLLALCAVLNTAVKYAIDWFLLPYAQADGVSELLSVLYRHAGTAAACLLTAADAALFTCGMQVQILKRYMKESAGYADVFYGFVHWTRPVWYAVLRALLSLIPAAAAAYAALRFPVWPVYAAGIGLCGKKHGAFRKTASRQPPAFFCVCGKPRACVACAFRCVRRQRCAALARRVYRTVSMGAACGLCRQRGVAFCALA